MILLKVWVVMPLSLPLVFSRRDEKAQIFNCFLCVFASLREFDLEERIAKKGYPRFFTVQLFLFKYL